MDVAQRQELYDLMQDPDNWRCPCSPISCPIHGYIHLRDGSRWKLDGIGIKSEHGSLTGIAELHRVDNLGGSIGPHVEVTRDF